MKNILIALAFSAALLPQTETKPTLEQVRSRAAYSGVIVLYNGILVVARLDSSMVIDMSGGAPTIRAVAILPVPVEEEFSPSEGQAAFTLTGTPAPGYAGGLPQRRQDARGAGLHGGGQGGDLYFATYRGGRSDRSEVLAGGLGM